MRVKTSTAIPGSLTEGITTGSVAIAGDTGSRGSVIVTCTASESGGKMKVL